MYQKTIFNEKRTFFVAFFHIKTIKKGAYQYVFFDGP